MTIVRVPACDWAPLEQELPPPSHRLDVGGCRPGSRGTSRGLLASFDVALQFQARIHLHFIFRLYPSLYNSKNYLHFPNGSCGLDNGYQSIVDISRISYLSLDILQFSDWNQNGNSSKLFLFCYTDADKILRFSKQSLIRNFRASYLIS